jgi:Na+/proline symporter
VVSLLTFLSGVVGLLLKAQAGGLRPRTGIVPVAVFTLFYTMFGGLPSSI